MCSREFQFPHTNRCKVVAGSSLTWFRPVVENVAMSGIDQALDSLVVAFAQKLGVCSQHGTDSWSPGTADCTTDLD